MANISKKSTASKHTKVPAKDTGSTHSQPSVSNAPLPAQIPTAANTDIAKKAPSSIEKYPPFYKSTLLYSPFPLETSGNFVNILCGIIFLKTVEISIENWYNIFK
jgi:hypothetical protein